MSIQKPGYPNVSVKLYENYDAWKENRFAELASTLTTLTLRDGLYGRNEGILQFHDTKIMHTYLNGEQIIQISVANANSENVLNRIYGSKHFSTSVDEKGDNIIAIELAPIHQLENLKFSRCFFSNAEESISEMIRVIYRDRQLIAPKINGLNISVPRVPWTYGIKEYMDYIREVGIGVDSENFVFVWEDFRGINMMDYPQLTDQEAVKMVVGEPRLIGQYQDRLEVPLAYDFVWLTKANQHTRNPMENVTIYSYSFADQGIERLTIGDGSNSIMVNRSGGYADMTFRNGYEEGMRLLTMAQYDGYATCKLAGNFEIMPGTKINFGDMKSQFKTDFYVDEVIHEISNNMSITNLYMFTNGKELKEIELEKVKTVPPTKVIGVTDSTDGNITEGTTEQGVATGSKSGSDWDLDKLASVVTANARGRSSTGDCALYVRKALQQAQLKKFFSGGLGHANQMGPSLTRMGWKVIGANVSSWRKGDIVIFQKTNTKLGQKYGHVAIFNGSQWVSDFIQNSVQPNRTSALPYTLYRAVNPYTAG